MADQRLGIGALDAALGEGYGFEHNMVLGMLLVTRPSGSMVSFHDTLTLEEALERIQIKPTKRERAV